MCRQGTRLQCSQPGTFRTNMELAVWHQQTPPPPLGSTLRVPGPRVPHASLQRLTWVRAGLQGIARFAWPQSQGDFRSPGEVGHGLVDGADLLQRPEGQRTQSSGSPFKPDPLYQGALGAGLALSHFC